MTDKNLLFLSIFILFGLLVSCKQPETVIVDETPSAGTSGEPSSDTTKKSTASDFRHLIIGETAPISSMDPLFAENNATKRVIQQLFEGLVRYNAQNEIVPALAKRWEVGSDSMNYTFTLRSDVYYHDSEIFGSGVGRKTVAGDVKYVLERMAGNAVPDEAARLFMNIKGFEPYFQEQHNVFISSQRELKGVSGITVSSDSTLTIQLTEPDDSFLQKLASPYAVIYPREAVGDNPSQFQPVGTGPFTYSKQQGDSLTILVKHKEYWMGQDNKKIPAVDRVDIVSASSERSLFQQLSNGNIHLVPELGPQLIDTLVTPEANIRTKYSKSYEFGWTPGVIRYQLRLNPGTKTPKKQVLTTLEPINYAALFGSIPNTLFHIQKHIKTDAPGSQGSLVLTAAAHGDPFSRMLLSEIENQLSLAGSGLKIKAIRTPTRNTELYIKKVTPLYQGKYYEEDNESLLLTLNINHSYLKLTEIRNLKFNRYPWWIDLRTVNLPGIDRLDITL